MFDNQSIQPDQILPEDQETDILEITAEPYPDKRRIKVLFRLSSFASAPNASITLTNEDNQLLVSANMVNIFNPENEITLHLPKNKNQPGEYSVTLELFSLAEEETGAEDGPKVTLKQTNIKSRSCSFTLQ
ncbi:MAG: hypothetical protein J7L35_01840 [Anaerolineales bacterium]|nr:hypothetical protein [Anaerolineales bacterium]